ncbi:NADP-dependent isocitrate dehydrogenase [Rufibacter quisquiliarum]|uniref:isocitrate dehydrogenase (NADP(+)) n=1 Tax=Rufibacter quisquiliarum TaxID=1549639 RepID=A0A839GRX5_9BACT|nr:monomeric isocitrate dehydrogenase [Rufibacter quisquiliarum]
MRNCLNNKIGGIDNRGSHFYLALYWAQALAKALTEIEEKIVQEQIAEQGKPVDMGGYFHPDFSKVAEAMRPSAPLKGFIDRVLRRVGFEYKSRLGEISSGLFCFKSI